MRLGCTTATRKALRSKTGGKVYDVNGMRPPLAGNERENDCKEEEAIFCNPLGSTAKRLGEGTLLGMLLEAKGVCACVGSEACLLAT